MQFRRLTFPLLNNLMRRDGADLACIGPVGREAILDRTIWFDASNWIELQTVVSSKPDPDYIDKGEETEIRRAYATSRRRGAS